LLHVFIGEDDYSLCQALEDIRKSVGDATALMTNTTVLDGKSVRLEQLRSAGETMPFLAEKRLVIVEGLLERFESSGRHGRKKAPGRAESSEECRKLAEAMKNLPPFTELVVIGGRIRASNPLLRELSKVTSIRSFPPLKHAQLYRWVERRIREAGSSISLSALTALVRFVGNDLWSMDNEVDKLVLYTGGQRIEEADVKAVVSNAREEGRSRTDIQSKLGLTSEFSLRKAWEQADKYPPARLRELYHRLLETDISIKTGRVDGEIALNILITELGQRGAVSA
jgi:DNA polymerase-3 subunit delta